MTSIEAARTFAASLTNDRLLTHRDSCARVFAREVIAERSGNGQHPLTANSVESLAAQFQAADEEVNIRFPV